MYIKLIFRYIFKRDLPNLRKIRPSTHCYPWWFSITTDYEKGGLLNSITIEAEYNQQNFPTRSLVRSVFELLDKKNCLELIQTDSNEGSVMACVFDQLKVNIDDKLPSLVRLLATSKDDISRLFALTEENEHSSLTSNDSKFISDFNTRVKVRNYLNWFIEITAHDEPLVKLLGKEHINQRIAILEAHMQDLL